MKNSKLNPKVFPSRIQECMEEGEWNTYQLAEKLSLSPSTISRYMNGKMSPKITTVYMMADIFQVNPLWLLGERAEKQFDTEEKESFSHISNLVPVHTHKIPLLGDIACGTPILAQENFDSYVEAGTEIRADFALRAQGDSMIGARILDGDIVFVRQQPIVENGEIAVVLIDDEATLKRFHRVGDTIILSPENPNYQPIILNLKENDAIRILGKAIAFQSDVR